MQLGKRYQLNYKAFVKVVGREYGDTIPLGAVNRIEATLELGGYVLDMATAGHGVVEASIRETFNDGKQIHMLTGSFDQMAPVAEWQDESIPILSPTPQQLNFF